MKAARMTRGDKGVLVAVVAACAACCAGPLLAVLAAIGVTSALAAFVLPGLAVVTVAAGGGVWWLRRRSRAGCVNLPRTVDLAMPTLRPVGEVHDGASASESATRHVQ